MKKTLTSIVLLIVVSVQAQSISVDGISLLVSQNNSFPLWLASGSNVTPNLPVSLLSVVEYTENSIGAELNLAYSRVLNITESTIVPAGKVWKVVSAMEVGIQNIYIPVDSLQIGDDYAGGIVFYLDGNGGGKVCAKSHTEGYEDWTEALKSSLLLVDSGFDDWYLPTSSELLLVYEQIGDFGNFQSYQYWTSTDANSNNASHQSYSINMSNGSISSNYSASFYRVRAIRAF